MRKALTSLWRRGFTEQPARARLADYLPALIGSAALGAIACSGVLERVGHPAVPLDDSFIHFQYARRLAEGGFFSYVEGRGYTSGATSLLWPALLSPFYALGLRGLSIVYAAWALGTLFHAALVTEAARLARPLAGTAGAVGAGAMCLGFGGFAWFAWSGMETIALGWVLLRAARLAAELIEADGPPAGGGAARADTPERARLRRSLLAVAVLGSLTRPEGALSAAIAAGALALRPFPFATTRLPTVAARMVSGLCALSTVCIVPLLHASQTGSMQSTTAAVKWLVPNPYYEGGRLWAAIRAHVELLLGDILQGGTWGAIFVPEGLVWAIGLGAVATISTGARKGKPWRAALVLVVALATLAPTTYLSFLWNRVRYVWPFAGAWFVMLACLAHEIGSLVRWWRPRATFVTPLVAGLFAGALSTKLPWSLRDLAQSAHAIDRQQVALAHWARASLPADARIGVNDTGAIAYLSERETFDVVGLTTMGEAKYWVAGAGSRFEHYETMGADALPTHFIVYPGWMGVPAVLGAELERATVEDQSILGGVTKVAYEARYDLLGSGSRPVRREPEGRLIDTLDVSDLESERAHDYQLGPTTEQDNQAVLHTTAEGQRADGGRFGRRRDRFLARLEPGKRAELVMRVAADARVTLDVRVGGEQVGEIEVGPTLWEEVAITLPAERVVERTPVEVVARDEGATFGSLHYWFFQPD